MSEKSRNMYDMVVNNSCSAEVAQLLRDMNDQHQKFLAAISWALGEQGDFNPANADKPEAKYWWRKELRERAGL